MNDNFLKEYIVNKTCNGKCSNCGECCVDFLPIDKKEIETIKRYIRRNSVKECRHLSIFDKRIDLTCPFRDNVNKKCTIYEVRPAICRHFICSKPEADIYKQRDLFYRTKNLVCMRNVFFNGMPLNELFSKIMKQN